MSKTNVSKSKLDFQFSPEDLRLSEDDRRYFDQVRLWGELSQRTIWPAPGIEYIGAVEASYRSQKSRRG